MQITSLTKMDEIVNSRYNLRWDGWDIIEYKRNAAAFLRTDGVFWNGRWHTVKRIVPDRNGWKVPAKWGKL